MNNYVARTTDGKMIQKRTYVTDVGCGANDPAWQKDHSALVVPKVAVEWMKNGGDIEEMVRNHPDRMDFMKRIKVQRNHKLMWGTEQIQKISRYYVCGDAHGRPLSKVTPMTANQRQQCERTIAKHEKMIAETPPEKQHLKKYTNAVDQLSTNKLKLHSNGSTAMVDAGWNVQVCNRMTDAVFPINYDYYITEVRKLIAPIGYRGTQTSA